MVGFNRRFAPLVERLEAELASRRRPRAVACASTPGPSRTTTGCTIPRKAAGGCSARAATSSTCSATIAGSPPISAHAVAVPQPGRPIECSDSFSAHIRFARAVGTLVYSGGGDPQLPKERLEVFGGGVAAVLDDFRRLTIHRGGKRHEWKSAQDKGHRAEVARFLAAVRGETAATGGCVVSRLHASHAGARRVAARPAPLHSRRIDSLQSSKVPRGETWPISDVRHLRDGRAR